MKCAPTANCSLASRPANWPSRNAISCSDAPRPSPSPGRRGPELPIQATITLTFADRHKRRIRLLDDAGAPFLLDLPHAVQMNEGDLLECEDGSAIAVRAAAEAVLEAHGRDAVHGARLAWHVGNRHTPVQVLADGGLRMLHDHVLRDMLVGLGATVEAKTAPFVPEAGAYTTGGGHHYHDPWQGADGDHDHA